MNWTDLWLKARALLLRKRIERELHEELDFHIQMEIRKNVRHGMTAEEARRQARIKFGAGVTIEEECRDARGVNFFDQARQDLRYAFRNFAHNPAFTLVAVLTIALGIGATTAIFSIINSVLIRPLPYKDSDQIVRVIETRLGPALPGESQRLTTMRMDDFEKWRQRTQTLSQMALYQNPQPVTFSIGGEPTRLIGSSVSPAMFPLLGIQPLMGRVFSEADEKPGSDGLVLSYSAWLKYFSGKPDIVGLNLRMTEGGASTIIGVMPRGFEFPDAQTEFWDPSALRPGSRNRENILARAKAGIPIEQATIEANGIFNQLRQEEKQSNPATESPTVRIDIIRVKDDLVEPVRQALLVLAASVGLLLLIACVNVANLLLVRAVGRQHEVALRAALGASRSRLIRQLMTESVTLAVIGGTAGVIFAFCSIRLLSAIGPGNIPRLNEIKIDVSTLGFAVTISLLTGIVFGLAPALRMLKTHEGYALKEGASHLSAGFDLFRRNRMRSVLALTQVATATVLLVAAGLLINSFLRLSNVDPGYEAADVLTFQVPLPPSRYPLAQSKTFNDELLMRLETIPGVVSAGFSTMMPLQPFQIRLQPRFEGSAKSEPPDEQPVAYFHVVSPNYLKTMGIHLLSGRELTEYDRAGQPLAALINKTFAQHFFPNENPIGKREIGPNPRQIVGIVDDVRHTGLDKDPLPELYESVAQVNIRVFPGMYFAVRTTGKRTDIVPRIRTVVRQLDAQLSVDNIATMEERISGSVAGPRFYAVMVGLFAGIAVALAAIGIGGIIAYSVSHSTREIGIRVALGAERRKILALVLRQSVALAVVGITLGLAGAAMLTHYLTKMLFGLTPLDPITFIGAATIFVFVAVVASYLPARRATKVDPLVALRYE